MTITDEKPARRSLRVTLSSAEWVVIDAEAKRLDLSDVRLVAMLLRGLVHQLGLATPEDRPLDRR